VEFRVPVPLAAAVYGARSSGRRSVTVQRPRHHHALSYNNFFDTARRRLLHPFRGNEMRLVRRVDVAVDEPRSILAAARQIITNAITQ